jgi:hypothetical protein
LGWNVGALVAVESETVWSSFSLAAIEAGELWGSKSKRLHKEQRAFKRNISTATSVALGRGINDESGSRIHPTLRFYFGVRSLHSATRLTVQVHGMNTQSRLYNQGLRPAVYQQLADDATGRCAT